MHTEWYLEHDKIACWKCRACDTPRRWANYLKTTPNWEGKPLWYGQPICHRCHGIHGMYGESGGSLRNIVIIAIVIGRSCVASIITRSSWYGIVITRIAPNCVGVTVHSLISIGRHHLYG